MWKKCNLILIATEDSSCLMIDENGQLLFSKNFGFHEFNPKNNFRHINRKQLYIVSDEEIKEGDYVIPNDKDYQSVWEYKPTPCPMPYWGCNNNCKKVIASSKELKIYNGEEEISHMSIYRNIFLIPYEFIKQYVEEYNKGNKIEEIFVEYDSIISDEIKIDYRSYKLKVDLNNTITIKTIKDNWNIEEITNLFLKFLKEENSGIRESYIKKWIKENL